MYTSFFSHCIYLWDCHCQNEGRCRSSGSTLNPSPPVLVVVGGVGGWCAVQWGFPVLGQLFFFWKPNLNGFSGGEKSAVLVNCLRWCIPCTIHCMVVLTLPTLSLDWWWWQSPQTESLPSGLQSFPNNADKTKKQRMHPREWGDMGVCMPGH